LAHWLYTAALSNIYTNFCFLRFFELGPRAGETDRQRTKGRRDGQYLQCDPRCYMCPYRFVWNFSHIFCRCVSTNI